MDENEFKLEFLGWEYDKSNGANVDKIWGLITINSERVYAFWGRRGETGEKPIRYKQYNKAGSYMWDRRDGFKDARKKEGKGYKSIDTSFVNGMYPAAEGIYPGFSEYLKNQLMMARLCGKVMNEET